MASCKPSVSIFGKSKESNNDWKKFIDKAESKLLDINVIETLNLFDYFQVFVFINEIILWYKI